MGHDISKLYELRNNFTIIGLTGRSGSGVSSVAKQLEVGFGNGSDYPSPYKDDFDLTNNTYRKYRIVHKFAAQNFDPYTCIQYRDVLMIFILKYGFASFKHFLLSSVLDSEFRETNLKVQSDFKLECDLMELDLKVFNGYHEQFKDVNLEKFNENSEQAIYELFFSSEYKNFCSTFFNILSSFSKVKRNKTLQVIANNLRRTGQPYNTGSLKSDKIFTISILIKNLIKSFHKYSGKSRTQIVIDSLRNPIEIMFFRQRFSAYYTVAINRKDEVRQNKLEGKYGLDLEDAQLLFKEEYNGAQNHEFYKQKVSDCIQHSDIHINFLTDADVSLLNRDLKLRKNKDNTTPFFSWKMQLLKYVSLICQPGLIPPSPEERCMQMAFTAKYNSGCISRQVGAAITDEFYSLKSIGWNNTPEGQVPCVLRNVEDLVNQKTPDIPGIKKDLTAFSPYELDDTTDFSKALNSFYNHNIEENRSNLKGRNVCFCFKSVQNSCEGKNQVHTRSLHAEESAFLQITKYGGIGIKGGKLFSTASPCELCSKKAYQLGIKVIYYIDPYPGISRKQILEAGDNKPELRLFNGAIGHAYHWLYQPFMAFKDELSLILGNTIKDKTSVLESEIYKQGNHVQQLEKEIAEKIQEIEELKQELASKKSLIV